MLASDRRALLATGFGAFAVFSIPIGLIGWASPDDPPFEEIIAVCLPVGAVAGTLAALGSGAAWMSYTAARVWLAARGRLPWRLNAFLREAHERGVLRQAGAAYQIRHDFIRGYLVERWASSTGDGWSRPSTAARFAPKLGTPVSRRRVISVPAAVIALGSLPAVAAAIDPRPQPRATIDGSFLAISPDGRFVATVTDDGRVRLSDPSTGHTIITFGNVGHLRFHGEMRFSPDGRILAIPIPFPFHSHSHSRWRTGCPETGEGATVGYFFRTSDHHSPLLAQLRPLYRVQSRRKVRGHRR